MISNWSIRLVHDRRKKATDKVEQPVEVKIYLSRSERVVLPTGIKLCAHQWDDAKCVAVNHPNQRRVNAALARITSKYTHVIESMVLNDIELTKANFLVQSGLKPEMKSESFIEFCYAEMDKRKLRDSTKRAHSVAIEALRRSGCINTFADINPRNIRKFDEFLRDEDPTREQTTLHGYHKRIKPYINEAIRQEIITDSPYRVFRDRLGQHKERIPLTADELNTIRELDLYDSQLSMVRDQFVFCCYTGLAWADLDAFDFEKHTVTKNGVTYICGMRMKTGSKFFTPILPPAMEILKKHRYQFHVPPVQSYNRSLKTVAEIAGIRKKVTSHIARHTFATTVILENEVPIEALSKMLGHKRIQVTQVYAKILDTFVEKQTQKIIGLF